MHIGQDLLGEFGEFTSCIVHSMLQLFGGALSLLVPYYNSGHLAPEACQSCPRLVKHEHPTNAT